MWDVTMPCSCVAYHECDYCANQAQLPHLILHFMCVRLSVVYYRHVSILTMSVMILAEVFTDY